MDKYTVQMKYGVGLLITEGYKLVKVHEDNGRFEFIQGVFQSIEEAKEKVNNDFCQLPAGQHIRIFKSYLEQVR